MEAKRFEISTLLLASFKKTEISKQLNVSRMIVHRVEQRLKDSEFHNDHPRSGRPEVVSHKATKITFDNDSSMKIKRLAQKQDV